MAGQALTVASPISAPVAAPIGADDPIDLAIFPERIANVCARHGVLTFGALREALAAWERGENERGFGRSVADILSEALPRLEERARRRQDVAQGRREPETEFRALVQDSVDARDRAALDAVEGLDAPPLSWEAAASVLGISVNAVKIGHARAIARLRRSPGIRDLVRVAAERRAASRPFAPALDGLADRLSADAPDRRRRAGDGVPTDGETIATFAFDGASLVIGVPESEVGGRLRAVRTVVLNGRRYYSREEIAATFAP